MSTATVRRGRLILAGLLLTFASSSCSRSGPAGVFRSVELTKEELISLYEVPIDKKPARKYEWRFATPQFVRAVLERRDSPTGKWKSIGSCPFNQNCDEAFLIEQLDLSYRDLQPNQEWNSYLTLRIGGSVSRGVLKNSGWSGSRMILPLPGLTYDTESQAADPDRILIINSGPRSYRLRMECSDHAFSLELKEPTGPLLNPFRPAAAPRMTPA